MNCWVVTFVIHLCWPTQLRTILFRSGMRTISCGDVSGRRARACAARKKRTAPQPKGRAECEAVFKPARWSYGAEHQPSSWPRDTAKKDAKGSGGCGGISMSNYWRSAKFTVTLTTESASPSANFHRVTSAFPARRTFCMKLS